MPPVVRDIEAVIQEQKGAGMKIKFIIAGLVLLLIGCDRAELLIPQSDKHQPTNGTTVLLFPEWAESSSHFEQEMYTNIYAVCSDGAWHICSRKGDGSFKPFWKKDPVYESIGDAKRTFDLSIQWNTSKVLFDSLNPASEISSVETDLPPGWKLQKSNAGEWRWTDDTGFASAFEHDSRQDAIDFAWRYYNHKKREQERIWEDVR